MGLFRPVMGQLYLLPLPIIIIIIIIIVVYKTLG